MAQIGGLLLGGAFAALAGPAAYAADAPPVAADTSTVEEVVITASRRDERVQDAPSTVSAFTGGQLEARSVISTKDISKITPGVFMTQSGVAQQPTIRGVGLRGVGVGDESVVPLYIDGVYQPFVTTGAQDFNSIQRVEVLKGPQSALYGRNATGGAINIITRTPSRTFGGDGSLSYGRFNEVIAKGYVTGPLAGNAAGDLAFVYRRDDGYFRSIADGSNRGGVDVFTARAQVVFEPTSNSEVRFAYTHLNGFDNRGGQFSPINGNTTGRRVDPATPIPDDPYEVAALYEPYVKPKLDAGSLTAVLHLGTVDLHNITGISYGAAKVFNDSDATAVSVADQIYKIRRRSVYQELYLQSTDQNAFFSWIAGGVYFHDVAPTSADLGNRNLTTLTFRRTLSYTNQVTDSYAAYIQGAFKFNDQWSLILSGRYTKEEKIATARTFPAAAFTDEASFSKFTPTATLQYQPTDTVNVYAKFGQAFKSGLFNGSTTASKFVAPEELTQYEVGLKLKPASWLQTSLAVYYTDYKNIQASARDPVTGGSFLQNAAGAELYGVEGEFTARPTENLTVFGGFSLLHAEYTDFQAAQVNVPNCTPAYPATPVSCVGGNATIFVDASGKTLIRTPLQTYNLGGSYTWRLASGGRIVLNGNAYYQGRNYREASYRIVEPSSTLVDATIAWTPESDRFTIALWGKNLLDQLSDITALTSASVDIRSYAPPRTYGVRISASF